MDETPSKDVYTQLESLSKHNPWFVQSLQTIMTQNIMADDNTTTPGDTADTAPSNHAVLALLLAAYLKPSQGKECVEVHLFK